MGRPGCGDRPATDWGLTGFIKMGNFIGDHFPWFIGGILALLLMLLIFRAWFETAHPCKRYDPNLTIQYYQRFGDITVPVYGHACLERE